AKNKNMATADAALRLVASRPDPDDDEPMYPVDADGRVVTYWTDPYRSPGSNSNTGITLQAVAILPNGLDARAAAATLRRLAGLVGRHGADLLNLPNGPLGHFDAEGNPQRSFMSADWSDYDEDGRPKFPEIE